MTSMKTFSLDIQNMVTSEDTYSTVFDFSELENPRKIEVLSKVTNLQMGANDGSGLGVVLQTSIDEIIWHDYPLQEASLDSSNHIVNSCQYMSVQDDRFIGNKARLRYYLTQASTGAGAIESKANFKVAVLVK